ncbi:uncharacterized protein LOC123503449 [Portunus trituberculatus]|uniref:uncharacterized protein LOC123503449 n=1 Tax=Portunus trituberculatus TaxID=210409 RepID=UPI001E1CECEB|nr:uncharacterized protein LOC123503449 [Portunus trituberculatus]
MVIHNTGPLADTGLGLAGPEDEETLTAFASVRTLPEKSTITTITTPPSVYKVPAITCYTTTIQHTSATPLSPSPSDTIDISLNVISDNNFHDYRHSTAITIAITTSSPSPFIYDLPLASKNTYTIAATVAIIAISNTCSRPPFPTQLPPRSTMPQSVNTPSRGIRWDSHHQHFTTATPQGYKSHHPGPSAYLDHLVVTLDDWVTHLTRLRRLMGRLQEAGLTINLARSTFRKSTMVYLGHVVGNGKVRPRSKRGGHPWLPTTRTALVRFLGMAGFYRRFCRNFSILAAPLTDLINTSVAFRGAALPLTDHISTSVPFHWTATKPSNILRRSSPRNQWSGRQITPTPSIYKWTRLEFFECYLHPGPQTTKIFTDHNPFGLPSRQEEPKPTHT